MKKILLLLISTLISIQTHAQEPLRVVTTLSTFADLARQIGKEHVKVESIASPRFNPHFIEPKPTDVLKVKRADLFVHAGLDIELWRYPLVDAAGNIEARSGGSKELDLSEGISLLGIPDSISRSKGDIHMYGNPHYWTSPINGEIMANLIAKKLIEIDPTNAQDYRLNLQKFLGEAEARASEWKQIAKKTQGQELIAYHDEWPYLMAYLGIKNQEFLEPKPGIPPSPGHLERLEKYIKEKQIKAIVQATFYSTEAANSLAQRTGVRVVKLCQSVGELPECDNYLNFVGYNISQLNLVLQSE